MDNLFDREPYRRYADLRTRSDLRYNASDTSRVIEVPDEDLRLLHVSHLMFSTFMRGPMRLILPPFILDSVASFMAMVHFNQRNGVVIEGLRERLDGCDLYMTMDMLDSRVSPIVGSRQIFEAMSRKHSLASPRPGAVVGSFSTSVSKPTATLTSATQIPQISGAASAKVFDNKDQYPTFARTVPTAYGYAAATIELLQHLNVSHVALVYTQTDLGVSYFGFLQQTAAKAGITLVSVIYDPRLEERKALKFVEASGFRYIVTMGDVPGVEMLLEMAYDLGLAGPGFQWITAAFPTEANEIDAAQSNRTSAFNGLLAVEIEVPQNPRFFGSLMGSLRDPEFTSFFVDSHPESFIWDNYAFNETPPIIDTYTYTHYDAVMAVGISACEANARFFTGLEQYGQLKKTTFSGASGEIEFDSITGTRKLGNLRYAWTNFLIDDELSTNETVVFTPHNPISIDYTLADPVVINSPIIFADNSTTPPSSLPAVGEVDLNLIPLGIRIFGWILAGVLMALSLGFAAYTYWKRERAFIRASQPIFLGMLCVGTLAMASSIIPLSLQEPIQKEGLDIACMSVPWLYTIGFSTAFSSLFTKAWRINKVVRNSVELQRVQVHAKDVIWPFVLLTMSNMTILITWTIVAPLEWSRNDLSTDQYGRVLETYGACSFPADSSRPFLLLLAIFNGLVVVFANYQSYIGRNNPTEFNESSHVAISMASLLECFLISGPILVLVGENPQADFSVKTILIFVSCCAILLPIFIPKFTAQRDRHSIDDMHRSMQRMASIRTPRRSTKRGSGLGQSSGNDEASQNRKLEYLRTRSSQDSSYHDDEHQHRLQRRVSHASNDSGLASSVQELRKNALRSKSMVAAHWA